MRVNKNLVRLGRLVGAVIVTAHLFGSAFTRSRRSRATCARYASNDADVYCPDLGHGPPLRPTRLLAAEPVGRKVEEPHHF